MNRRFRRRRRSRHNLAGLVFLAAVAVAAVWFARIAEIAHEGRALVIDGDSLEISGERIRMTGIDAPELGQTCTTNTGKADCGRQSRDHLRGLISGRSVICSGWEYDRYDRLLAECRAGNIKLNRRMVTDGWALASGAHEADEREARRRGLGVWAGEFDNPRQWRIEHPRPGQSGGPASDIYRWLSNALRVVHEMARNMYLSVTDREGE